MAYVFKFINSVLVVGNNHDGVTLTNYNIDGNKKDLSLVYMMKEPVSPFIGKEDVLTDIANAFERKEVVVLAGLGGVGKSEIAREFCKNTGSKYQYIIWIDCTSDSEVVKSLENMMSYCKQLQEGNRRNDFFRNFRPKNNETYSSEELYSILTLQNTLLIFDNFESDQLVKYLPDRLPMSDFVLNILITSPSADWGVVMETMEETELYLVQCDGFSKIEASTYLKQKLNLEATSTHDELILKLANELSCHPLSLRQVQRYIKKERSSINKEAKTIQAIDNILKDFDKYLEGSRKIKKNKANNIFAIVDQTRKICDQKFHAKPVFDHIGFFSNCNIPNEIIKILAKEEDITQLQNYFVLKVDPNDSSISIRKLLQRTLRIDSKSPNRMLEKCINVLEEVNNTEEPILNLIPHFVAVWNFAQSTAVKNCFPIKVKSQRALVAAAMKDEDFSLLMTLTKKEYGSLLHFAARFGYIDLLKHLIEQIKMDINEKDSDGRNCLFLAVLCDHSKSDLILEMLTYLINNGCDIAAVDVNGDTLLHLAALLGNNTLVQYLIEIGNFDVNIENKHKQTALHYAARGGYINVVKYLSVKGARNVKDKDGKTALDYARSAEYFDIVDYLKKHYDGEDSQF